jgi:hypothetical protein
MTHQRETDVDQLVNDVARRMTAGDPARDLRERVISRIARPAPGVRFRWAPTLAVAAAALIVVGWWLRTPSRTTDAPATMTTVTVTATRTTGASASSAIASVSRGRSGSANIATLDIANRGVARAHVVQPRVVTPAMSETERAWRERAIPALPAVDPLVIEELAHPAATIAPLEIEPLVTPPLAVRPLGASGDIVKK